MRGDPPDESRNQSHHRSPDDSPDCLSHLCGPRAGLASRLPQLPLPSEWAARWIGEPIASIASPICVGRPLDWRSRLPGQVHVRRNAKLIGSNGLLDATAHKNFGRFISQLKQEFELQKMAHEAQSDAKAVVGAGASNGSSSCEPSRMSEPSCLTFDADGIPSGGELSHARLSVRRTSQPSGRASPNCSFKRKSLSQRFPESATRMKLWLRIHQSGLQAQVGRAYEGRIRLDKWRLNARTKLPVDDVTALHSMQKVRYLGPPNVHPMCTQCAPNVHPRSPQGAPKEPPQCGFD